MKKSVITLIAFTFCVFLNAQSKFYYGGMLGIGQSSFKNSSLKNQDNKLMVGGGIGAAYHFNDYVGLMVNGLLVSKGTKATNTTQGGIFTQPEKYEERYNLLYAEIPIMAKLRYGTNGFYAKLLAGPSFNFNINGTYDIDYETSNNQDMLGQKINNLKVMETALVYGAGLEVETATAGLYSLEFRVSEGLSSIAKLANSNDNIMNKYFSICLGWSFN